MLARILAAQSDLATALSQLGATGDSALHAQVASQLQTLAGLERTVTSGNATALATARSEIAAAVAASTGISQQARDGAQRPDTAELAASAASRQQVQSLMREMHRFDPYLRFASADDEAEYRRREAERRTYIEEQHRRGTPEGNLNAAGAAVSQMADAGVHGAANSPEFRRRFEELTETTGRLRDEVRRSGRSTREFDDRMRADLRRTLRARGVTDAEIEARFAAYPDPLEAVTDYVRSVDDLRTIEQSANAAAERESTIVAAEAPAQSQTVSEAIARLRAAGVSDAVEHPTGQAYAHGVTANERPANLPVRPPAASR